MEDKEKTLKYWSTVSINSARLAFDACTTPEEVTALYCELAKENNQLVKTTLGRFGKEKSA